MGAPHGAPTLVRPRLGQGAFRLAVTDAYERRCAVTDEKTLPILDAAHIRAFSAGGEHDVGNGLLLRTDIHRLFDLESRTHRTDRGDTSKSCGNPGENAHSYFHPPFGRMFSGPTLTRR